MRVSGSVVGYTYATAVGVSFTAGKDIYATVGVGRTRNSDLDATTFDVRAEAGADIPLGRARRVFLCPLAGYALTYGPNDYLLTRQDYRYRDASLGVGVAVAAVQSRRLAVLLTAGLRASRLTTTRTSWPTVNNGYKLWSLAAGVVLDSVWTIRPTVTIPSGFVSPGQRTDYAVPFGREQGEVSLGISVGFSFGRQPRAP